MRLCALFVNKRKFSKLENMNEEIDENEFYHQDFTTASEWEIFIARLEEIVTQWKTDDVKSEEVPPGSDIWRIRTEPLSFADFNFILTFQQRNSINDDSICNSDEQKKNAFDSNYNFKLYDPNEATDHSCLADWYGINEFIVLSPASNVGVTSESRIKVLLSSAYIVSGNLKCELPIFVQIRDNWQRCYLGVYELEGVRTNLEMVHLRTSPRLCQYLSGLLELFKSKIVSPMMMTTISVSLQSTYVLNDFGSYNWRQQYLNPDIDEFEKVKPFVDYLGMLPFGVTVDPISAILLKTTWTNLNHRAVRDSESYSDFNPMLAQKWSLLMSPTDQPLCLLGEALSEFLPLFDNNYSTVGEVLSDFITSPSLDNNPLDLLTESKVPTISTLLTRAARSSLTRNRRGTAAPLSEDVLVSMLYFVFPDADDDSPFHYNKEETTSEELENLDKSCAGFKTSTRNFLIWRLATVMAHCLQSLGGVRSFAYFWYEFVQEMRYRWEKCFPIPGLLPGYPDLRTSLLHQKLQMLNCCIERKQARENSASGNHFDSAENSSADEDDDEFFDCDDNPHQENSSKKREKHSLWNQPVGRLSKFDNFKLIKSGDPLYIPITQEPVPKTEDQLEEDTAILLKLGSDAQGSEMRAKMMSASLLSDMESFKAANPGSILEDFIRWYSPRDWLENDETDEWGQRTGSLSPRMQIADNFWIQTWESAKPVPAQRQKRLFDDTREAEKILHYLESRNLSQIAEILMPTLAHVAIFRLYEEIKEITVEFPSAGDRLRSLVKVAERISREGKLPARLFDGFVQEVTALELKASQAKSLLYKFNPAGGLDDDLSRLIGDLITGREVEIGVDTKSVAGRRMVAMFGEAQKSVNMIVGSYGELQQDDRQSMRGNALAAAFPQANEREIVMRVRVPRPATYSAQCPQVLRAILAKNEFRLVAAFSEDTTFF